MSQERSNFNVFAVVGQRPCSSNTKLVATKQRSDCIRTSFVLQSTIYPPRYGYAHSQIFSCFERTAMYQLGRINTISEISSSRTTVPYMYTYTVHRCSSCRTKTFCGSPSLFWLLFQTWNFGRCCSPCTGKNCNCTVAASNVDENRGHASSG